MNIMSAGVGHGGFNACEHIHLGDTRSRVVLAGLLGHGEAVDISTHGHHGAVTIADHCH